MPQDTETEECKTCGSRHAEHRIVQLGDGSTACPNCLYADRREGGIERLELQLVEVE